MLQLKSDERRRRIVERKLKFICSTMNFTHLDGGNLHSNGIVVADPSGDHHSFLQPPRYL
tara:strand:- start:735 stop:914 length:180 start_codon:yes stop_codon:yes gene_type:complete